jgi:XTP/dITP diphosphohydrolase
MDDVPTGQPALALAQKIRERVAGAGLPDDLVPATLREVRIDAGGDVENDLRTAVLEFIDTIRQVEQAVFADRRGDAIADAPPAQITEDEWRAHWPLPQQ